jgi:hypothetical protein
MFAPTLGLNYQSFGLQTLTILQQFHAVKTLRHLPGIPNQLHFGTIHQFLVQDPTLGVAYHYHGIRGFMVQGNGKGGPGGSRVGLYLGYMGAL